MFIQLFTCITTWTSQRKLEYNMIQQMNSYNRHVTKGSSVTQSLPLSLRDTLSVAQLWSLSPSPVSVPLSYTLSPFRSPWLLVVFSLYPICSPSLSAAYNLPISLSVFAYTESSTKWKIHHSLTVIVFCLCLSHRLSLTHTFSISLALTVACFCQSVCVSLTDSLEWIDQISPPPNPSPHSQPTVAVFFA